MVVGWGNEGRIRKSSNMSVSRKYYLLESNYKITYLFGFLETGLVCAACCLKIQKKKVGKLV